MGDGWEIADRYLPGGPDPTRNTEEGVCPLTCGDSHRAPCTEELAEAGSDDTPSKAL